MGKTKSSSKWLQEHFSDVYVKKAQEEGYRSRAVYKLKEILEKDRLIQPRMTVVDLGAAPGGWSQIARAQMGKKGTIIATDILPMEPIEGVEFVEGDFTEEAVYEALLNLVDNQQVDLVLSDMAPNMSGNKVVDQPRMMYLVELALDFCRNALSPGGNFLVKVFQGEGFDPFMKEMRGLFQKVIVRKPAASRGRSREVYLLGRHYTP